MALGVGWGIGSVMVAAVPKLLRDQGLDLWSGLVPFLATLTGILSQIALARLAPERMILVGLVAAVAGFALVAAGGVMAAPALLGIGALVTGTATYGLLFAGSIGVMAVAGGVHRARAATAPVLCGYLSASIPLIGFGASVDAFGWPLSFIAFGSAVAIASVAAAGLIMARPVEPGER